MCAPTVANVALPATRTVSGTLTLTEACSFSDYVIVYFYPRDDTPGCTCEANDFRDVKVDLDAMRVSVIGVSPDDMESHSKFSSKLDLNFPLVADDGSLADAFQVWKNHPVFGKVVNRSTFVLRKGEVVKEWRSVKSEGHADAVVAWLKEHVSK